jgi:hypothetical protein
MAEGRAANRARDRPKHLETPRDGGPIKSGAALRYNFMISFLPELLKNSPTGLRLHT